MLFLKRRALGSSPQGDGLFPARRDVCHEVLPLPVGFVLGDPRSRKGIEISRNLVPRELTARPEGHCEVHTWYV